ncbi:hypothetical protein RAS1_39630 [Phycisphaerae bacterium RAS1]|nr:hypothetical protein RAS1_39630 [Phycisphaerae bacterium RAS1]
MGAAKTAKPVKLFAGLLGADVDLLRRARQLLSRRYGRVDLESDIWEFVSTDYYESEMGRGLKRWFIAFEPLLAPDRLAEVKLETNAIEAEIADAAMDPHIIRPVNIDPGYLNLGKLILASVKDHAHRIYLGAGIYGEVTLRFTDGAWQAWPWTFPDYRLPEYHAFFDRLRARYREQREQAAGDSPAPREHE